MKHIMAMFVIACTLAIISAVLEIRENAQNRDRQIAMLQERVDALQAVSTGAVAVPDLSGTPCDDQKVGEPTVIRPKVVKNFRKNQLRY